MGKYNQADAPDITRPLWAIANKENLKQCSYLVLYSCPSSSLRRKQGKTPICVILLEMSARGILNSHNGWSEEPLLFLQIIFFVVRRG